MTTFRMKSPSKQLSDPASQPDPLGKIPSPATRLWIGLCVILSIFLVFVVYSSYRIRWLEDFQANVVQRNRKASLQLLRLQNDAYLLAISIRDLALSPNRDHINDWQPEFTRLYVDMKNAAALEGQFAIETRGSRGERIQLRRSLEDFSRTADKVFLSQQGDIEKAHAMVQTVLESKRAEISEVVARLLVLNDEAQVEATETINQTYEDVKLDIVVITAILFLLALATGLYTFKANRKTFARLRHLAEQLHVQSGQLRKLSWKLIDVQEETLRHVARDLHDEFGQILTAIGIMLNRAERNNANPNGMLLSDLGSVKVVVEDTLEKVRDQSQMFRPGILDDFGIVQALDWFTRQFSRQAGIPVHFSGEVAEGRIPPDEAIHLYRIVQEALSNVARHSKATQAWVAMEARGNLLDVEIRDDGVGFDAGELAERSYDGFGLMGMRERAEHLSGRFNLESAPGKGTVIRVQVPLKGQPEPRIAEKAS